MTSPSGKSKIILFGTGKAGVNALKYYQQDESVEILSFCDSRPEKRGTIFEGLPVVNPKDLHSMEYDQILISSSFLNEIKDRLEKEEGIPSERIGRVPTFICLIASSPDIEVERQTLIEAVDLFDQKGVQYFLDSSALLSIVRSGDFLPWPHGGVDFSICEPMQSAQQALEVVQGHYPAERISVVRIGFDFGPWKRGDIRGIKVLDEQGKSLFTASVRYLQEEWVYWVFEPYVVRVPAHHIQNLTTMEFADRTVAIPSQTEQYLELVYGDDWRIPRRDWHWSDSKHIYKEVSYQEATTGAIA